MEKVILTPMQMRIKEREIQGVRMDRHWIELLFEVENISCRKKYKKVIKIFVANREMYDQSVFERKEAIKAEKSASRWNMRCMDLPPRTRGRWGKNTTIQAKASVACKYRDDVFHKLRLAMSEFIKEYL